MCRTPEGTARTAPEPMARPRLLPQVPSSPLTPPRPVIGLIGDGSSQYSVQSLWTAAQHKLPIVYVIMRNNEYSILKSFAVLEETPGVPGLDLPGLGIAAMARGWGCRAVDVETSEDLEQELKTALGEDTTTVIVVRTQPQQAML